MHTVLAFILFGQILLAIIAYGYGKTKDSLLLGILVAAAAIRLIVGFLNMAFGPLPGAEVDAVLYETLASYIARQYELTGHFVWEIGRLGYASLLAPFYVLAGSFEIIPTFVNLFFSLHFIVLVYLLAAQIGDKRCARIAAAVAAFYPTAVLYTSVSLREAPLLWAMALWMYGIILYMRRRAPFLNWRVLVGCVFAGWLHTGFFLLGLITPAAWYIRGIIGRRTRSKILGGGLVRFGLVGLGMVLIFFSILRFGGQISDKLPQDPTRVTDLQYIDERRGYKSSYGTGYVGYAPTSGAAFLASIPVVVFRFLFSPTPLDVIAAGGTIEEAAKMVDSLLFLGMTVWMLATVWNSRKHGQVGYAILLAVTLVAFVVVFAIGTANVGIAMRHRAKFAWVFGLIIALWHSENRHFSQPVLSQRTRGLRLGSAVEPS